ncbi:MAG TPA: hypothetical protein VH234_04565 [Candidatus Saccharimonadales bacterium]|jgi:hypothetical protein|nr:hypothetical protein [Candidatus Saccharimonadales bacterium]
MAIGIAPVGQNNSGLNLTGLGTTQPYTQVATQPTSTLGANTTSVATFAPTVPGSTSSGSTGTGVTGVSTANPNQAIIDQLNGQLGQLDNQQNIGLGNIQNSYQNSQNQLNQQNSLAQNQFNTQNQQNTQGYLNNRNNIITNTNAQANALQRLLGINGAGNSSAAYEQAPYAAAMYGSQNLNNAQQTYGNNASDLNNNWQQTESTYKNDLSNLDQQLYGQQNGLKSSIAQTRANILSQLSAAQNGTTQYDPQINSLLGQITQLSNQYANPVLAAPNLSYTPSSLANYSLGPQTAGKNAPSAGQSDVNPTFLSLLGQQRDQFGNLMQAA